MYVQNDSHGLTDFPWPVTPILTDARTSKQDLSSDFILAKQLVETVHP
jgi:hypothetical protein